MYLAGCANSWHGGADVAVASPAHLQFPEKLIPKFTLLAARGADLPIHGDGLAVRRYVMSKSRCCTSECCYVTAAQPLPS